LVQSTDVIALLIFVPVQWRITVLWLRFARRRFSGPALVAARAGIVLLDAAVALGWLLDLLTFLGHPPVSGLSPFLYSAGSLAYCMTATAVLGVRAAFYAMGKLVGAEFHPGRRRALAAAGNFAMAAPFAAMAYGALIERLDFRVREVDVPIPGLPAGLDGLRLLHLSDIHLSAFLSESQLARVVDAANGLRPHLAAVTGDLISAHGDPIDACIRQLARLRTGAGVVACMGNHEGFARVENYAAAAGARAGISFLRSQSRPFRFGDATLHVAGVDYQPLIDRANYLRGAERLLVRGETNLLLSHNPDVFPVAARQGYNLMLAGHTHGGQVSVEILDQAINPARFLTPYVYGLYRIGAAAAYVTRGIGTIGIPARIGAPPEISLLRLRKA
jgi:predicted MPP superfamily phosphohydrolase